MMPRARTTRRELTRESGSVLRLPEGVQLDPADIDVEAPEDETMILNLGPSHPSTHGVLRVMVELDGETVLRSKPVVGYLHTGMEKTGRRADVPPGRAPTSPAWTTCRPSSTSSASA